jgi:hypothetical protein
VRADRSLPSLDATAHRPTITVSTATAFMACHRALAQLCHDHAKALGAQLSLPTELASY